MKRLIKNEYHDSLPSHTGEPILRACLEGNHIDSHGFNSNIEFTLMTPKVISSDQSTPLHSDTSTTVCLTAPRVMHLKPYMSKMELNFFP